MPVLQLTVSVMQLWALSRPGSNKGALSQEDTINACCHRKWTYSVGHSMCDMWPGLFTLECPMHCKPFSHANNGQDIPFIHLHCLSAMDLFQLQCIIAGFLLPKLHFSILTLFLCKMCLWVCCRVLWPYHGECTGSHLITEVKQHWARLISPWMGDRLGISSAFGLFLHRHSVHKCPFFF